MQYLHTNQELVSRFFSYMVNNFLRSQVSHTLVLKKHPENQEEMVFLSYRVGSHYIGFEGVPDHFSFVLRTRAKEGISMPLKYELGNNIAALKGAQKEAFETFFGTPGFSERKIQLIPNLQGIETIVEVPFTFPEHYPWTLEISAFPNILSHFIKPANEIVFQKSKERVT